MNEQQAEQLSVLLDGELGPAQTDQLAQRLATADREVLDTFGRYRLIGDSIRGEADIVAVDVAERVRARLAEEPTVLAPKRRIPAWMRPAAGVAIAASVAATAIFVAPQLAQVQPGAGEGAVRQLAGAPVPAMAPTLVASQPVTKPTPQAGRSVAGNWRALNDDVQQRLNRLVIEHQEFGGRSGINGPVPHIGLVSYDRR
ncbi:MAG: sigma-E factor negative regulatory protein [Gammaproteobacteria bacterium]|nr:sigma-E factor negative regulatory protein [Gammaproteobacteria bacterium]